MKKLFTAIIITALMLSSAMVLSACGSDEAQESSNEPEAAEQNIELMGISKYSRTELNVRTEFDVSNHQINENGQITQFDLHRTKREKVTDDAMLIEDVDAEDSTIMLEYDENGNIISARTDTPGYGYMMHELTYKDGLIDTDSFSTDWGTNEDPYKHQYSYEENEGTVSGSDGEVTEGKKKAYPCVYEYNDNGDVIKITMSPGTDYEAVKEYEYDDNGYVTKITGTNAFGTYLICEFEYVSLGEVGKADAVKTGFRKWQEFTAVEDALMNCF